MPVHPAGPRLYRSIKFKYLVKGAGSATHGRASNISLNLTPFVDMMTILVAFLLMVFSSSKLLQVQAGLDLPIAMAKGKLQDTEAVIVITKSEITFKGEMIATVDSVLRDESPTYRIERLFERLEAAARQIKIDVEMGKIPKELVSACDDLKNNKRPGPDEPLCPDGMAILQADLVTDIRVINKVVVTAKAAGFDNLLFAIKNK
ncbi:MAG TPA: biopolymer transporter ExbD [Kofleriaceae bacterium]